MERHYQLKITSQTTNIDVDSIDSEEVARIVQLAGLEAKRQETPPMAMSSPPSAPMIGSPEIPMDEPQMDTIPYNGDPEDGAMMDDQPDDMLEDIADYDHGAATNSKDIDASDYIWEPEHLEQRFGKMGDNTLKPIDELSESLYKHLTKAYRQYVAEAERENDGGIMSPLSDPTKPEFDKDPFSGDTPVDDGSQSPLSQIKRQPALK